MSIKIIADDLGLYESVNDGTIFLLKNGKIDGASLMANGVAFNDAIQKIGDLKNKVGIHFVLVEEKSLSGIELPKNHKTFFIKYILGLIKLPDIEKELRAQLDKVIGAGFAPQFINSHQHLHLLPGIMSIVIKIAKEKGIKYIRLVNEPIHGRGKLFRKLQLIFLRFLSNLAKQKLNTANLEFNGFFVGFINAGNFSLEDIKMAEKLTNQNPKFIIEAGCHPGNENTELKEKYKWGQLYNWKKELDLLESKNV